MPKKCDLYLVGIGINGLRQMTVESQEILESARIVLHDTYSHRQLKKLNPNTKSLEKIYWTDEEHAVVYDRMYDYVLDEVSRGSGVALVTYGHPFFFDSVNLRLSSGCEKLGYRCIALPGVSSLDTLSCDLNIDYGDGLQVFEASSLVDLKHPINPNVHTMIFQIGEFGMYTTSHVASKKADRFKPLQRHLLKYFPKNHEFSIICSDDGDGHYQIKGKLADLNSKRNRIVLGSTMYVPPRNI